MSFNLIKPYNDLPLLPPKADVETKEILKKAISANRALAELKGSANLIPNPEILLNAITLQEAKSSSEIENVVTTNDRLFKAFSTKADHFDDYTKEVLRYREALWEGFNELKSRGILSTNLFVKIYQKIKETDAGIRNTPDTKLVDDKGKVIYTPPEDEKRIRDFLQNLEKFIYDNSDGIDPLIKSAIIHYQFEAIHPFTDGNGRTGRIVFILYLILIKYLELPILYLSRYIIENKNKYYHLLKAVTENNDWEPWILYLLNCIESTSNQTIQQIEKIKQSLKDTINTVRTLQQSPVPKEVLELIYVQPYSKSEFIINKGIAKRKAAERYLKELERLSILKSEKVGKEIVYVNLALFKILSGKNPGS
ncbi:MAG: Fic family protein [Bacteroidetes bacterium]|nr:Fic family protein [Bacteroidota bacterium]